MTSKLKPWAKWSKYQTRNLVHKPNPVGNPVNINGKKTCGNWQKCFFLGLIGLFWCRNLPLIVFS